MSEVKEKAKSEVREIANKTFKRCLRYPGDEEGRAWLMGFLACAEIMGEIDREEIEKALKRTRR